MFQSGRAKSLSGDVRKRYWSNVYQTDNPEEEYGRFMTTFTKMYERSFSYKVFKKPRKARKPWINKECLTMIKQITNLFNRFLSSKSLDDLAALKAYRNKVTLFLRRSKNEHMHKVFDANVMKRGTLFGKA